MLDFFLLLLLFFALSIDTNKTAFLSLFCILSKDAILNTGLTTFYPISKYLFKVNKKDSKILDVVLLPFYDFGLYSLSTTPGNY